MDRTAKPPTREREGLERVKPAGAQCTPEHALELLLKEQARTTGQSLKSIALDVIELIHWFDE